ncbi:hypothetical protein [Dactylosporangium sp. CS-033363]|uniref:hypothetical protein n=1 Tax=Dactylosporangium sp. CS-033363 TaxID=3239935 RepID=UPI003D9251C2
MERSSGSSDAVLIGGPRDGATIDPGGSAVVEYEIGGFIHRYILTTQQRERDDRSYQVFNYDGEIDPKGAMPGAETPEGGVHDTFPEP